MDFVSEVLKDVDGIQWYYITGIFIFIALFLIILYRTIRMTKNELIEYKTSIFEED